MKNETQKKLYDFVAKNPKANVDAIAEGTGILKLHLHKTIKALLQADALEALKEGKETFYSVKESVVKPSKKAVKPKVEKEVAEPKDEKEESKEKDDEIKSGRDFTKYSLTFGSIKLTNLSKGRLAREIVNAYVSKNKAVTLNKLKELFPDSLIKTKAYEVCAELSVAKKATSNGRDRYFLKPDEIINLKNMKIACSNQWNKESIAGMIRSGRKLGLVIK